jgi:hypothetical protein
MLENLKSHQNRVLVRMNDSILYGILLSKENVSHVLELETLRNKNTSIITDEKSKVRATNEEKSKPRFSIGDDTRFKYTLRFSSRTNC